MTRYCLLPYDSDSDDDGVWAMMGESSDTNQPVVGSNVNGRWMNAVDGTNSSVVGFTANCSRMDSTRTNGSDIIRDGSWNEEQEQPTFLKRDMVCRNQASPSNSAHDTESQWKQWNNNNSIAFTDTLNTTLATLNNSIQERVQIEREKLAQQYNQEMQELQILRENLKVLKIESREEENENCNGTIPMQAESISECKRVEDTTQMRENLQVLKIEPSKTSSVQESREEQKENCNGNIPMQVESTSEFKRADNTTQTKQTVPTARISREKNDTRKESLAAKENMIKASESKTTLKPDHVLKAENLLERLNELQKSIEPFSKEKSASKRRLKMKKTVCGKFNTLTDSAAKVMEVAEEVKAAIQAVRQEDAQGPNMGLGELYLLDLFSSNILQRVQADGFNGPRGDGFPLAATAAQVACENDGIIPVLEAHVYKVCPMSIPRFPDESSANTSEEDLMQSLGMQRDKSGDFESWDRFANRTENIVAMVANIQASMPATNPLFGGHQGAADWLERFLESLPSTTPLPLLTAPVLHGFLSGAGHMLANQHEIFFKRSLKSLSNDILDRLDTGAIGKPSFTRLSKLLGGGFDGFRSKLPPKAIPTLYNSPVGPAPPARTQFPANKSSTARPKHPPRRSRGNAAVYSPSFHKSISEDAEMTDNDPVSTKSTFSHAGAPNTAGNTNMQFSNGSPFGFNSPTPNTNVFGSVHPTHGFGFGAGHNQLRNPFEATQIQKTKLRFGKASDTIICQKAQSRVSHQNPKSTSRSKSNNKKNNKNNTKKAPPCKYFAKGKCRFGSKCKYSHES